MRSWASRGARSPGKGIGEILRASGVRPLSDRVFDFHHVDEAYVHLAEARHRGKIAVSIPGS